MSTALVWFRNDLRIHDHEALNKAISKHEQIIPFYCFEDKQFGKAAFGFEKTGSFRAQFLIESVINLKQNLQKLGSNLIIRKGKVENELGLLLKDYSIDAIYTYKDIHQEEIESQLAVETVFKKPINYSFGSTLYHVKDLPHSFQDTPEIFTEFRKGVETESLVRQLFTTPTKLPPLNPKIECGEIPSLATFGLNEKQIDERAAIKAKGGEDEALKRLNYYFYETEELSHYKEKRNGLMGMNYSSKLSFWLWNGCISPRKIYWEVKNYESTIKKNQSTYWLIFELIWRDYFKMISLKHGNKIFQLNGIKNEKFDWKVDRQLIEHWTNGTTGIPFIDANIRELNSTGFISNRGRQNVASFLVKELGLDWRIGAAYFESQLIDYDVASNYGNWMYIAGVGNDPRDRYFNIISQAKRYDANGHYIKLWIPELKHLNPSEIHHPWSFNKINSKAIESFIYPEPIANPAYWERYY
tara:strand:- start:868 stop:2277 length:1410 start_codon:yes stop_codon:yes gene_type:complete